MRVGPLQSQEASVLDTGNLSLKGSWPFSSIGLDLASILVPPAVGELPFPHSSLPAAVSFPCALRVQFWFPFLCRLRFCWVGDKKEMSQGDLGSGYCSSPVSTLQVIFLGFFLVFPVSTWSSQRENLQGGVNPPMFEAPRDFMLWC